MTAWTPATSWQSEFNRLLQWCIQWRDPEPAVDRANRLHEPAAGEPSRQCTCLFRTFRETARFEQGLHARARRDIGTRPSVLSGSGECKAFVQKGISGFLCGIGQGTPGRPYKGSVATCRIGQGTSRRPNKQALSIDDVLNLHNFKFIPPSRCHQLHHIAFLGLQQRARNRGYPANVPF